MRGIKAYKIRDAKSELATQMLSDLNEKFNEFGVYIECVYIMNVVVPTELREA